MSDTEGLMWRLEKDPHLSSSFATVSVLDRPLDAARMTARLDRATALVPRLRQRVQPGPVALAPPQWVDDPDFDLSYHVRHVALPQPGSMRQLLDLATQIASDPFERTRPLWEFVMVDGLEGGKGALIQKMHHAISDGEAGVRLSMQFLDVTRDAPDPPAPAGDDLPESMPPPEPSPANAALDLLAGSLRLPLAMARQVADLAGDPRRLPEAGAAAVHTVQGIATQLSDTARARSPLWTRRSLRRHVEVLRAPLTATKAAAAVLGGSVNSAFLTAVAAAAGDYHRRKGSPVDHLRASMAISTRTRESGANAFTLARLLVPTAEMDLAERFAAIQEITEVARDTARAAPLEVLAVLTSALPTSVVTRLARQQAETVDFATSNVRGGGFPLYVAGSRILENYPIGPLAGVAFNLTLLSYDGSLDMALNIDPAAVEDPAVLRHCLATAFDELLTTGR